MCTKCRRRIREAISGNEVDEDNGKIYLLVCGFASHDYDTSMLTTNIGDSVHLYHQKEIQSYNSNANMDDGGNEHNSIARYFRDFKAFLYEPLLENHSHQDIFYLGLLLMPIWFLGNILYNYSLLMTSISSSTVIRLLFYICI